MDCGAAAGSLPRDAPPRTSQETIDGSGSRRTLFFAAGRPSPPEYRGTGADSRVNVLELASETDLCFVEGLDQAAVVRASRAGAVLVPEGFPEPSEPGPVLIESPAPRRSFFRIAELFAPGRGISGVHPSAAIDPGAVLGQDVAVGPNAVIAAGVQIGDRSAIGAGCYLAPA